MEEINKFNTYKYTNNQVPTIKETSDNIMNLLNGHIVEVGLYDLHSDEFKLKEDRCIPAFLQYQNLTYIITQDNLNLWGEAKTLDEAEKEIARAIIKLYKKLDALNKKKKLGPYPKKQLDVIKEFIT